MEPFFGLGGGDNLPVKYGKKQLKPSQFFFVLVRRTLGGVCKLLIVSVGNSLCIDQQIL